VGSNAEALVLTLGVGIAYLLVLRLIDLNEREPFWSLSLALLNGMGVSILLRLLVGSEILELTVYRSAAAREAGTLVAFACTAAMLRAIGKWRGWSEINDLLDGLIYGAASGLGVALGELLQQQLAFTASAARILVASLPVRLSELALGGLAAGLFGALIGAGAVARMDASSRIVRTASLVAGCMAAFAAHVLHAQLLHGDSLSGQPAVARAWIALLLPLVAVLVAAVHALGVERAAIEKYLAPEVAAGLVSRDDLELLSRALVRQRRYLAWILTGRVAHFIHHRGIHNLQVQLALASGRLQRVFESPRREVIAGEIGRLRDAIRRRQAGA
jgi:hypothetical protein